MSIRGDIQAIKTQLLAGQYPCSLSKLIKNGNEDIKPKFELPRTKTVDLRQHWNFVQADVPNKNTGFLLRTLEYGSHYNHHHIQTFLATSGRTFQIIGYLSLHSKFKKFQILSLPKQERTFFISYTCNFLSKWICY